jgi:hypothetical protein
MGIKKADTTTMTIRGAIDKLKKGTLNLEHRIQRRNAWTEEQGQLLISSILENIKIPGIVVVEENGVRYALDGKQRITKTTGFFENKFPLSDNVDYFEDIDFEELESEESITLQDIIGKRYEELPQAVKNKIQKFEFKVDVYKDLTNEQTKKLYKRYNGGTALTKVQLLHCDSDFMNDVIQQFGSQPFFKDVVNITDKMKNNFIDENVIKQSMLLIHYQGDTGVEDNDLKSFVAEMEEIQDTTDYKELISTMKEITEYMNKALTEPLKNMRRAHVPIIVYVAYRAVKQGTSPENFGEWVRKFLDENTGRKADSEYKDLSGQGASKKSNIKKRIDIALNDYWNTIETTEETETQNSNEEENNIPQNNEPIKDTTLAASGQGDLS